MHSHPESPHGSPLRVAALTEGPCGAPRAGAACVHGDVHAAHSRLLFLTPALLLRGLMPQAPSFLKGLLGPFLTLLLCSFPGLYPLGQDRGISEVAPIIQENFKVKEFGRN